MPLKFTAHAISDQNTFATVAADNILKVYSGKKEYIATVIDTQMARLQQQNREFLRPIVEIDMFCGEKKSLGSTIENKERYCWKNLQKKKVISGPWFDLVQRITTSLNSTYKRVLEMQILMFKMNLPKIVEL